jgi:hypothetical protein
MSEIDSTDSRRRAEATYSECAIITGRPGLYKELVRSEL